MSLRMPSSAALIALLGVAGCGGQAGQAPRPPALPKTPARVSTRAPTGPAYSWVGLPEEPHEALSFRDDRTLAVLSNGLDAFVWDVAAARPRLELTGGASRAAFSPR